MHEGLINDQTKYFPIPKNKAVFFHSKGDWTNFMPVLFEYCGNKTMDSCCQNVHNIDGPYSCLVYSITSTHFSGMLLNKQVLLDSGYEYFLTGNDANKEQNLETSLSKLGFYPSQSMEEWMTATVSQIGKRTSMSLFAHTTLEWL